MELADLVSDDSLLGLPRWLSSKEPACNAGDAGDMGSIPGLGRDPGEGNGYPLQYSCLENPMNRGAWWATVHRVTKSWTWLKRLSMHACTRTCFLVHSSCCDFTGQKESERTPWGPFVRHCIPFRRGHHPHDLPKAPPPNTTTLGVRISTCEFWGDRNILSFAWVINIKQVAFGRSS